MQKDVQRSMKYAGESYNRVAPPKIEISKSFIYLTTVIDMLKAKRKQPEKGYFEDEDDTHQIETNYYGNNKFARIDDNDEQRLTEEVL